MNLYSLLGQRHRTLPPQVDQPAQQDEAGLLGRIILPDREQYVQTHLCICLFHEHPQRSFA